MTLTGIQGDPGKTYSKKDRLTVALINQQRRTRMANHIMVFIKNVMTPVSYTQQPGDFARRQGDLNEVLVHVGFRVNDEGRLARGPQARTLDEAAQHANSLRIELRRRATHPEVLAYCTAEILTKNAFHASLEASKSVSARLRQLTGEQGDGSRLVDATLMPGSTGTPRVAINSGSSTTDLDEQRGFANVLKGLLSMYRNPTAHDPRIHRQVTDDELLELLTTLSMIHRRLDTATVNP
ncbi:TIGR02391 family protein [Streptomyces sp. NPDC006510]|uniref:TIGR02391 family protein n=1 Tax=Streptomyces sp. NPDC006510 TaxID=3155600 RepID=UPI0033B8F982